MDHKSDLPILNSRTRVFAAFYTNHDGEKQEKEAGHGKAHAVDWFVAYNDVTVNMVVDPWNCGSPLTKTRNLKR